MNTTDEVVPDPSLTIDRNSNDPEIENHVINPSKELNDKSNKCKFLENTSDTIQAKKSSTELPQPYLH